MSASLERKLGQILAKADIEIDGNRSWDIKVNERRFFGVFCPKAHWGSASLIWTVGGIVTISRA